MPVSKRPVLKKLPLWSVWYFLAVALLMASVFGTPSTSKAQEPAKEVAQETKGTHFHCSGYPNDRPDLKLWGSVHSGQAKDEMVWSHGSAIRLERIRPNLMKYEIWYRTHKITDGTLKGSVVQFAMTAGGVELHCSQAKEAK